jgi:hypothetical protein
MNGRHWTDEDLINSIYGIGPQRDHLDQCPECRERWLAFQSRRSEITVEPEVSADFLAAQRRMIYHRIEQGPQRMRRLVPAFVAMLALLIALMVHRPGSTPAPGPSLSPSDEQLTSDIYSMEQSSEPQAARAMHALFEGE